MTNYTKTTDFAAKDALPSGNSAKIVKGSEIDTEFNNIATASATKANANSAALTGTTTFETISDGTIAITAFVDEDNMASDSATLLPTQQSVKAYVDSQVTAQDLDVTDGSTSIDIDLDSESLGILGGTGIDSTALGTGVTLAIDSTVATLTGSQTLSNKTLSAPVVSGNLTTDGLLDGRDVATDGAKLDGIESGATADQTAAEIKTAYESNADTNAFTDADESKLDGIEASADVTDTANVTAAGALMDSELTSEASVKALNQGVATTDSPTFAGLTTTADISFGDNDKAIFGSGSDLQIYHDGSASYIDDAGTGNLRIRANSSLSIQKYTGETMGVFTADGSVLLAHDNATRLETTSTGIDVTGVITTDGMTTSADINFGDNDKAVFGAGSDLQIYHDGSHSYVSDQGTGDLRIIAADFRVRNAADDETMIQANADSDVSLWYNNSKKLATTSAGIDVTGRATVSATTPSIVLLETDRTDENTQLLNTSGDFRIRTRSDDGGTNTDRFRIDHATGDISFYEDTGTTPKLFWDSSAESLGIGTSSPTLDLSVDGDIWQGNGAGVELGRVFNDAGVWHFRASTNVNGLALGRGTEAMRIDASGNVGIGTSSPDSPLEIQAATNSSSDTTYLKLSNAGENVGHIDFENGNGSLARITGTKEGAGASANDGILTFSTAFDTSLSERMRIDSSGNVGIASGRLRVAAGDDEGTQLNAWTTAGGNGNVAAFDLVFNTGANNSRTEAMRIDSSGNVGIGTSSPAQTFVVAEGTNQHGIELAPGSLSYIQAYDRAASDYGDLKIDAQTIQFGTDNGTERMRIDSSGAFMVGTTSSRPAEFLHPDGFAVRGDVKGQIQNTVTDAQNAIFNRDGTDGEILLFRKDGSPVGSIQTNGGRLDIQGASNTVRIQSGTSLMQVTNGTQISFETAGAERARLDASGNLLVGKTSASAGSGGVRIYNNGTYGGRIELSRENNTGTQYPVQFYDYAGSTVGSISNTTTATAYNTSSDQRLKENIVDAPSASDDIDAIQVRSFDWKADGSHQKYGMVAQELQTVVPEAVAAPEDPEEMMGVDYSKLVPMLVKEIQSLRARVAQLENN